MVGFSLFFLYRYQIQSLQFAIDTLYGEPHHIVVTAVETRHADVAYPFLDAIGTSLVEGLVMADVVTDLLVAERLESHVGRHVEGMLLGGCQQANTRGHLMRPSAEQVKHTDSIFLIRRLPQYLITHDDDGIGRDHQFVIPDDPTVGIGLLAGDVEGYLAHGQVIGIGLVDPLQHAHLEGKAKPCQEFLPPRRMTR